MNGKYRWSLNYPNYCLQSTILRVDASPDYQQNSMLFHLPHRVDSAEIEGGGSAKGKWKRKGRVKAHGILMITALCGMASGTLPDCDARRGCFPVTVTRDVNPTPVVLKNIKFCLRTIEFEYQYSYSRERWRYWRQTLLKHSQSFRCRLQN